MLREVSDVDNMLKDTAFYISAGNENDRYTQLWRGSLSVRVTNIRVLTVILHSGVIRHASIDVHVPVVQCPSKGIESSTGS
jgi:hypothetical protein